MKCQRVVTNENGLAMVLAISMIGLLSLLGIWLVLQSQAGFRITSSLERRESVFNLSDGAIQLVYRCLVDDPPAPSYNQLMTMEPFQREFAASDLPSFISDLVSDPHGPDQPSRRGSIRPRLFYVDYSTTPPPGWMLNKQGYLNYYGLYHKPMGDASIPLPASKGNSRSVVSSLTERVMR